ncbi:MAG: hypothetical protein D4R65_09710 [Verrucomicrobiaceae bacterium]|nr:MAG: hypothetical protein D4R65_09710 [Verrucomicrobiaceae bacterium]
MLSVGLRSPGLLAPQVFRVPSLTWGACSIPEGFLRRDTITWSGNAFHGLVGVGNLLYTFQNAEK